MKVLVACEYRGKVRDAFKAKGHDAWSETYSGIAKAMANQWG